MQSNHPCALVILSYPARNIQKTLHFAISWFTKGAPKVLSLWGHFKPGTGCAGMAKAGTKPCLVPKRVHRFPGDTGHSTNWPSIVHLLKDPHDNSCQKRTQDDLSKWPVNHVKTLRHEASWLQCRAGGHSTFRKPNRETMKKDIHPHYHEVKVTCSCGSQSMISSTFRESEMQVEVCSKCHPFYTGKQKILGAVGQVEKYNRRYGGSSSTQS